MRNRSNQPGSGARPASGAPVTGASPALPSQSRLAEWPVRLGLLLVTLLTVWALFGDDLAQILGRAAPAGAPASTPTALTPSPAEPGTTSAQPTVTADPGGAPNTK